MARLAAPFRCWPDGFELRGHQSVMSAFHRGTGMDSWTTTNIFPDALARLRGEHRYRVFVEIGLFPRAIWHSPHRSARGRETTILAWVSTRKGLAPWR